MRNRRVLMDNIELTVALGSGVSTVGRGVDTGAAIARAASDAVIRSTAVVFIVVWCCISRLKVLYLPFCAEHGFLRGFYTDSPVEFLRSELRTPALQGIVELRKFLDVYILDL